MNHKVLKLIILILIKITNHKIIRLFKLIAVYDF